MWPPGFFVKGICVLLQVDENTFKRVIEKHDLVPNGFHHVGSTIQTSYEDRAKQEIARVTRSTTDTVYEVQEEYLTPEEAREL